MRRYSGMRRMLLPILLALVSSVALAAPASAAGQIIVPPPFNASRGHLLFLSGNGGTGNLSASMPAPAKNGLIFTSNRQNPYNLRNDDARSVRLLNVVAPLTIEVYDDSRSDTSKPHARIFIRKSGTYTIGSFQGSSSQGPFISIPLQGGGLAYSDSVVVRKFGTGQLDGKISAITLYGYDTATPKRSTEPFHTPVPRAPRRRR
jgi:hypothetical protein